MAVSHLLETCLDWFKKAWPGRALAWSGLARLGRSRVLRTSYFWLFVVPIAAKFLESIQNEVSFTIFSVPFTFQLRLPFSWMMFYWGAISFAVATTLFAWFCPNIIRDHGSFDDFRKKGMGSQQIVTGFLELFPGHATKDLLARREFAEDFLDLPADASAHDLAKKPDQFQRAFILEQRLADSFWFVRRERDYEKRLARWLCAAFYGLGFVCSAFVLAQGALYVYRQTFPST